MNLKSLTEFLFDYHQCVCSAGCTKKFISGVLYSGANVNTYSKYSSKYVVNMHAYFKPSAFIICHHRSFIIMRALSLITAAFDLTGIMSGFQNKSIKTINLAYNIHCYIMRFQTFRLAFFSPQVWVPSLPLSARHGIPRGSHWRS